MIARLMGLPTVDPATLLERMRRERVAVFDVNSLASWQSARLAGARHLDPTSFVEADLAVGRDQSLVFYCSNPFCRKAPLAARRARRMGFQDVAVLSAGISGWLAAGLPTETGT